VGHIFLVGSAMFEPVDKTTKLYSMKYKNQWEDHRNEGLFLKINEIFITGWARQNYENILWYIHS